MKIILAKQLGFCSGVKRALEIADNSLIKGAKPIQFLGEIIHNEKTIRKIKKNGGIIIDKPEAAASGTLVIRAHGAPPLPRLKNISIKDATCPLVRYAQKAAQFLFNKDYQVIIIGEKKHPEIIGIQGYIGNKGIVINKISQAKKISCSKKIGVMSQTTQNLEKINKFLDVLKKKTKSLKWLNTICPQVSLRQKELSQLVKKTAGILVVGSRSSANTARLAEIVKDSGKPVWRANSLKDLKSLKFNNVSVLGVVSGTSTPKPFIKEIVAKLKAC